MEKNKGSIVVFSFLGCGKAVEHQAKSKGLQCSSKSCTETVNRMIWDEDVIGRVKPKLQIKHCIALRTRN